MNDLIKQMPQLLNSTEVYNKLLFTPEFDNTGSCSISDRLIALEEMYNFFIPNMMTYEVYTKIYFGIYRSLKKKISLQATQQRNQNFNRIQLNQTNNIISSGDSFAVIGTAGIGKTASIVHSVSLATNNSVYKQASPYIQVIPCLTVQTPFDCSAKSLLLEIIRQIDNILHTNYYPRTIPTTDILIGVVCQLCLNHIGLLILDEIQNVITHRAGNLLIHCLTEIINNTGISICFVGTPDCEAFFSSTDYLARRTTGLRYSAMNYDDCFKEFCKYLWNYQPLLNKTEITESDYEWIYTHTGGVIANIITLLHDSQELAIISNSEKLDKNILNQAYSTRMTNLHPHINTTRVTMASPTTKSPRIKVNHKKTVDAKENIISKCVLISKDNHTDVIELLKQYIPITEVSV